MKFTMETAELFIPDDVEESTALARTTHMGVGAHQDDLEILATPAILACFQRPDLWFTGVTVTNGAGSARAGLYAAYTDAEMVDTRRKEQRKAAIIGEYAAQFLLDHPSSTIKNTADTRPVDDLSAILLACRPREIYTHNLADKHDTHVGVAMALVAALRRVAPEYRPERVYGVEVWRDLDWLPDAEKVVFDVSDHESLQAALVGVYDSQIAGGKRYDLATLGRRRANATYHASHDVDTSTAAIFAMDITPVTLPDGPDPVAFTLAAVDRFRADVESRIRKFIR
ncbi:MAG TPA: PIG-L family deacetylase [Candidatus Hydrogenedentes bacterium]|nr:PIG-L family deacetylase [Candidatus Hydrogenedentota bacterium]HOJ68155.1 PIG-L family deacetylase [Candidatus Hydrogenedentota bacterium]HOK89894.1 PIG-L family deacetylase [Candidatus Hydrogenedentota bacterium]HPO29607.1 PIG-L family deacetylase [Candidatus Hydrogenedentota bacterium]